MQHCKRGVVLPLPSSRFLLCLTYRSHHLRLASPFTLRPFDRSIRVPALYPKPYTAGELRPSLDLTACRLLATETTNSVQTTSPLLTPCCLERPFTLDYTIVNCTGGALRSSESDCRLRAKPCLYKTVTRSRNLSLNHQQVPEAAVKPDVEATRP